MAMHNRTLRAKRKRDRGEAPSCHVSIRSFVAPIVVYLVLSIISSLSNIVSGGPVVMAFRSASGVARSMGRVAHRDCRPSPSRFGSSSAFLLRPSWGSSGLRATVVPQKKLVSSASPSSRGDDDNDDDENSVVVLDPLIVCGPSGVGKGTIIQRFMDLTLTEKTSSLDGRATTKMSDRFGFSVSHTTRKPREGEVNGVHYHFVSLEEMERLLLPGTGYFLESAEVHGNYYGTSWKALRDVQRTGKTCLLDIDVQGVRRFKREVEQIRRRGAGASSMELQPKFVFITPPSVDCLRDRLRGRKTESEASLERRLGNAASEIEYGLSDGNFDRIVTNDDLDKAVLDFDRAVRDLYDI